MGEGGVKLLEKKCRCLLWMVPLLSFLIKLGIFLPWTEVNNMTPMETIR